MSETAFFSESQRFISRTVGTVLLILVAGVSVYALGSMGISVLRVLGIAGGFLLVALFHRLELTVTVFSDRVAIRFSPLFRKSIPLSDVRSCETRTYRPIREYGGWGIRRGRRGWAYTVRGKRGVELTLADGRSLLLGSQRPEELAAAIRERAPALGA